MSENLEQLQALAQQPSAVAWFRGLFRRAHMEVTDTGERFTFVQQGDGIQVESGFQGNDPNFVMPLHSENIRNLTAFFADNRIGEYEQYRIVKFMLVPCLTASLAMPILQNGAFRKIVKVDTHWQEAILDPDGNEDEQLTVMYANDQWVILPGYHGKPQRRLVMKPEQVLEFQRRVLEADDKNNIATWLETGRWYLQWRESVSVPV